jgi:hypothetical protein
VFGDSEYGAKILCIIVSVQRVPRSNRLCNAQDAASTCVCVCVCVCVFTASTSSQLAGRFETSKDFLPRLPPALEAGR